MACNDKKIRNPYVGEYIIGLSNIKGTVDINYYSKISPAFEIGASQEGEAVFKNPDEAFEKLKELYAEGIKVIKKEFGLLNLNQRNYTEYKTFGWQVTSGSEDEKEQARFVSGFLDIYENSFK